MAIRRRLCPFGARARRPRRREEQPRRVPGVLPDGEHQRREAAGGGGVDRGASLEQHVQDRNVVLGRRPHQWSLAAPRVRRVDVGAAGQQRADRRYGSRPRTREQRRLARGRQSGVGPRRGARSRGRRGRWRRRARRRRAVPVDRIGIRPGRSAAAGPARRPPVDGPVSARRPVDGLPRDVDRPGQQARHHCVGRRSARRPAAGRASAAAGAASGDAAGGTENGQDGG